MDELEDFFNDPGNRGIASGAELAQLLGCSEGYVREFGRGRSTRRVGSTLVYDRDDADALVQELENDGLLDDGDGDGDEDEDEEFDDEDDGSDDYNQ